MWIGHKWAHPWNRNTLTDIQKPLWLPGLGLGVGERLGFGISRCKLLILYIGWINNKVLLYSFPGGSDGKVSASNAGDLGSIPGSGRSLEKGMATHSSALAWKIPWTEEPGALQSMGLQRVRHDWVTNTYILYSIGNYIQYPVINHNGKKYEKDYIYMYVCISESLCYIRN